MSGIAGIVHWNEHPVPGGLLSRILGMRRHRGPDGLRGEAHCSVALEQAQLAMRKGELEQVQLVWLPARSCAIVADVRLNN
jgi:asparagine synthetase B (glutamine-hydrolysing)